MLNLLGNFDKRGYVFINGTWIKNDCLAHEILSNLCLSEGATFKGHINASKELLPNTNKLPIYLASFDDYLIPLASPISIDCIWFSANSYLTCYQNKGKNYIKFKDKSYCEVPFSLFTITKQYKKYQKLNKLITEMKKAYDLKWRISTTNK